MKLRFLGYLLVLVALQARLYGVTCTPASATFCIAQDDIAQVWLNGNSLGSFPYTGSVACVAVPAGDFNVAGSNMIAVKLQNSTPSEVFASWSLDIVCGDGTHTYLTNDTSLAAIQFYNTPSNCAATQPAGSGGNGNFWDPAWTPSGWGNPSLDTGSNHGETMNDPQTGLPLTPISYDSTGASSDACQYLWFRQSFSLTPATPTITPTPYPAGCGTPTYNNGSVLEAAQSGNNLATRTFSFAVTGSATNALMLVEIEADSALPSITSMTYAGITLNLAGTTTAQGSGKILLYEMTTPLLSGSNNLIVNFSPNTGNQQWIIQAHVFSGVDQVTPLGGNTTASQTGNPFTDNITTVGPASLIMDFLDNNNSQMPSSFSGGVVDTGIVGSTSGFVARAYYKAVGGPAAQSMTYNWSPSGQTIKSWLWEVRGAAACGGSSPTPTNSPSRTLTRTPTRTPTASSTPSFSPTVTRSATPSLTPTATGSRTPTPSVTFSSTLTSTRTATATVTQTATFSVTMTQSFTPTATRSLTPSSTPTATGSRTPTPSVTFSSTLTSTRTATATVTQTATFSVTMTQSFTPTATRTATSSSTLTASPSLTSTRTSTPSLTVTSSFTASQTITPGPSPTSTWTPTVTKTVTLSATPSPSPSASPSVTPSQTTTLSFTASETITSGPSPTDTWTPTATRSATPSQTPTLSFTASETITSGPSPTDTWTPTMSVTVTPSLTMTPSFTASRTTTAGPSPTSTWTSSATPTLLPTRTVTPTSTASATATASPSPLATFSATPSFSPVVTPQNLQYQVQVVIYNSAGEAVRHLYDGPSQIQPDGFSLDASVFSTGGLGVKLNLGGLLQGGLNGLTWLGTNDAGQDVAGGIYTIKMEEMDPFGVTVAWSKPVSVLAGSPQQSLRIYNSAGELVAEVGLTTLGPGVRLTSLGFAQAGQSCFSSSSGVPFALQETNGSLGLVTWDGKNSLGQVVEPGTYVAQLVDALPQGNVLVASKGFTWLTVEDASETPKVLAGPNPLGPKDAALVFSYAVLPGPDRAQVRLYNLAGEFIAQASAPVGASQMILPIRGWASGIYVAVFEVRSGSALRSRQLLRVALAR